GNRIRTTIGLGDLAEVNGSAIKPGARIHVSHAAQIIASIRLEVRPMAHRRPNHIVNLEVSTPTGRVTIRNQRLEHGLILSRPPFSLQIVKVVLRSERRFGRSKQKQYAEN